MRLGRVLLRWLRQQRPASAIPRAPGSRRQTPSLRGSRTFGGRGAVAARGLIGRLGLVGGRWAARAAVNAPARGAVMYPVFAVGPAAGEWRAVRPDAVEADLAELDKHEVEDDHH